MTRILLLPFSFLFGIITFVRNKLYDWKCIPSIRYDDIYVISVGNITVGGTGKTPFVEYLIRSFSQNYRVAMLSRGYKRTTKGFRFVENNATPADVGDEPYQIKRKFPDIVVAVDANRVRGIAQIRKIYPDTQVILLDDAFQYRKIRPNLSILLADYNRPLYRDSMLPGGRLREWSCFAKRADMMIVTKSPVGLSPNERQDIEMRYARIFPHKIFFTTVLYGNPVSVFRNDKSLSINNLKQCDILLVTGIANPKPFETFIRQHAASVQTIFFPDHHAFSEKDIEMIANKLLPTETQNSEPGTRNPKPETLNPKPETRNPKLLLVTEKDAVRLQQMKIPEVMAERCYYVPIEVNFIDSSQYESWQGYFLRAFRLEHCGTSNK